MNERDFHPENNRPSYEVERLDAAAFEVVSKLSVQQVLNLCTAADRFAEKYDLVSLLADCIDKAIGRLADNDPPRFVEICAALADDGSSFRNRNRAINFVPAVTVRDHDAGLRLWEQLIRDVDPAIREVLAEWVESFLESGQRYTEELGLSIEEAVRLSQAYENAEAGIGIYDAEAATLDKLLEAVLRAETREDRSD